MLYKLTRLSHFSSLCVCVSGCVLSPPPLTCSIRRPSRPVNLLPWVDKYENAGVTAVGKFMFPLLDYSASAPAEVECSAHWDDAFFRMIHARGIEQGEDEEDTTLQASEREGAGMEEESGPAANNRKDDGKSATVPSPVAASAVSAAAVGVDWITELIRWTKEHESGQGGAYSQGDTSVDPDDVQILSSQKFMALYKKAGFKRRVVDKQMVFVFVRPDGSEEPAYLASRTLPLMPPNHGEL